ncbi:DUF6602 domain-containing protein [Rhodanobacter sp. L36]|uniref:DUF6602 domain-containing protein n=1 Tax=Rhodanobacter sp. L36 TaxID=1747221 RepID=UPI00131D3938|nr:DUF6602 domain-containing protein [Rhodanobacter sp. L36]
MTAPFFKRLGDYYLDVARVLRGEANTASIFPNPSDIGATREDVYSDFLKQHAPSKCNVSFGGFVFGDDGSESGQLDVLITTDTAPRFKVSNQDGRKTFAPVEGTLGVASIKSTLNKATLEDALMEFARIPPTAPLGQRIQPQLPAVDYGNWPYKILYASDGINGGTLVEHLHHFYLANPSIPVSRRPDIIHVVGKYVIFKTRSGDTIRNKDNQMTPVPVGQYIALESHADVQAIATILNELQIRATISTHILFSYQTIVDGVYRTLEV